MNPLDYVRRDVRGRVVDHARYQFRKDIEPAIAGTSMGAVLLSKTAISALTRTQIQNHREMKVFQIKHLKSIHVWIIDFDHHPLLHGNPKFTKPRAGTPWEYHKPHWNIVS